MGRQVNKKKIKQFKKNLGYKKMNQCRLQEFIMFYIPETDDFYIRTKVYQPENDRTIWIEGAIELAYIVDSGIYIEADQDWLKSLKKLLDLGGNKDINHFVPVQKLFLSKREMPNLVKIVKSFAYTTGDIIDLDKYDKESHGILTLDDPEKTLVNPVKDDELREKMGWYHQYPIDFTTGLIDFGLENDGKAELKS